MSVETEIRKQASVFKGRLTTNLLDSAIDYCDHNENCLALEILCDHICEEDITLSQIEYQELLRLAVLVGTDLSSNRFKYLKTLVLPL